MLTSRLQIWQSSCAVYMHMYSCWLVRWAWHTTLHGFRWKVGPGCAYTITTTESLPSKECLLHTNGRLCCQPCRVVSGRTWFCLKAVKETAIRNILTSRPTERGLLIEDQQARFKTALKFHYNIAILEFIK